MVLALAVSALSASHPATIVLLVGRIITVVAGCVVEVIVLKVSTREKGETGVSYES